MVYPIACFTHSDRPRHVHMRSMYSKIASGFLYRGLAIVQQGRTVGFSLDADPGNLPSPQALDTHLHGVHRARTKAPYKHLAQQSINRYTVHDTNDIDTGEAGRRVASTRARLRTSKANLIEEPRAHLQEVQKMLGLPSMAASTGTPWSSYLRR